MKFRNCLFSVVILVSLGLSGCNGKKASTVGPRCGDGVQEGVEECDDLDLGAEDCASLGLGSGQLACDANCIFDISGCSGQAQCGNGAREYPEDCDGPDLNNTACQDLGYASGQLSCSLACTFDTSACVTGGQCGNDVQEVPEQCDGADLAGESCQSLGLTGGTLRCASDCTYDVSGCSGQAQCGNDVREFPEPCDGADLDNTTCQDYGFYTGTLACLSDCSDFDTSGCSEFCGDDVMNGLEVCDGSDLNNTTCLDYSYYTGALACSADCSGFDTSNCSGMCGDGNVDTTYGEQCDDGNQDNTDACPDGQGGTCVPAYCGDGFTGPGEGCDDGNALDNDGCRDACVPAVCGDGIVRVDITDPTDPNYEACDDGNGVDGDGCPDGFFGNCRLSVCGDGIRRLDVTQGNPGYEECDDGNLTNGDGCDATCLMEGTCGDGHQDANEACDLGGGNDDTLPGDCPTVCRTNCQCPWCGDGVTDFVRGEECDDGNTAAGDGCDAACLIEAIATCGDGVLDVVNGEECDDGNTNNGDGCSDTCQFEPLGANCGNSNLDTLEKCDPPEQMPADGDGCNATCNLTGQVTTLSTGNIASTLTSDNTYLWLGVCDPPSAPTVCEIQRIDLDACINSANCTPQVITGGTCGAPQDGQGVNAVLACPNTMTTDGITVWFANRHTIRALDIATGDVVTLAGNTTSCAAVDGTGANAYFHDIRGMTYWNGFVYLLDGCENVLRRFDPVTTTVTTIAGTRSPDPAVTQTPPYTCQAGFACVSGTPTPGYGLNADFGSPRYLTADNSGNLYITDTNGQAIWRYNTVTGYADILISGSAPGFTVGPYTDGAPGVTTLGRPRQLVSDGTSIYFAEQNYATIRQIVLATIDTSTFVGTLGCQGIGGMARDGLGADSTQTWAHNNHPNPPCVGGIPGGTPILFPLMGAMNFNFAYQSIFVVDSGRLRRIE